MITVTETAQARIGEFVADAGEECRGVRIRAAKVGKHTFRYQIHLVRDQDIEDSDTRIDLDGFTVVRCTPHIGYLHSGFEKLGEDLDYNQYVTITSRMNYLSPLANNVALVNTETFEVVTEIAAGERPTRAELQGDEGLRLPP